MQPVQLELIALSIFLLLVSCTVAQHTLFALHYTCTFVPCYFLLHVTFLANYRSAIHYVGTELYLYPCFHIIIFCFAVPFWRIRNRSWSPPCKTELPDEQAQMKAKSTQRPVSVWEDSRKTNTNTRPQSATTPRQERSPKRFTSRTSINVTAEEEAILIHVCARVVAAEKILNAPQV